MQRSAVTAAVPRSAIFDVSICVAANVYVPLVTLFGSDPFAERLQDINGDLTTVITFILAIVIFVEQSAGTTASSRYDFLVDLPRRLIL